MEAKAFKEYLTNTFRDAYREDSFAACMHLSGLVDKMVDESREAKRSLQDKNAELEKRYAKLHYRFAYVTCRQLLERVHEAVQLAHAQSKRDKACMGKHTSTITESLTHLSNCTMISKGLQHWLRHPTNKGMEKETPKQVFNRTSTLIHHDIYVEEQTLLLPVACGRKEIDFMVVIAIHNNLNVKVIDGNGSDLTDLYLSKQQKDLIKEHYALKNK